MSKHMVMVNSVFKFALCTNFFLLGFIISSILSLQSLQLIKKMFMAV